MKTGFYTDVMNTSTQFSHSHDSAPWPTRLKRLECSSHFVYLFFLGGIFYCYKPRQCCGTLTCCPEKSKCCGVGVCCEADAVCCGFNTCCPPRSVCCTPNFCCEEGGSCCGLSCCGAGAYCDGGICRHKA